ncbi:ABC transporter ATP-binding protein [Nocardiopsis composta]|uniref:ATP-binding cassette subfamily C protein n=1 Tax=Nocardiopsis composta TaxID=157465 RepID=A0A7W8QP31_9ACTN|nr:ABC transporter ATP-binding protein [Nocardiopsis composta]MBB5433970.1 ATP-binding cassette subfamily C protein [Nocardiopsis composta]
MTGENAHRMLPVASARQTWSVARAAFGRARGAAAATVAVSIAANLCALAAPWILGMLVDAVDQGQGAERIAVLAAAIAVSAVAAGLLNTVEVVLIARVGETALARLREDVVERALRLPAPVLSRLSSGDLLSRVSDDVSVVGEVVREKAPMVLSSLITVVLALGGMSALDWRLGLAGACALPVYVLSLRWYLPRSAPLYAKERELMGERAQALVSTLHGAETVHAYRMHGERAALIDEKSNAARGAALRVFRKFTLFAGGMNAAECVGLSAIVAAGFWLVGAEAVTVGAATAAALIFHRLFGPLGALMMTFNDIQSAGASLARMAGVTLLPEPAAPADARRPADGGIELRGVGHRYDGGPAVLDDVTLAVAPGERVALVGASGAGKTTLASAVAGVIEPAEGTVLLGGVPLDRIDPDALRRHKALVSQEAHVFAGTLADNVRLADPGAGDDRVAAALETVGALGWAEALPEGLGTVVGEGGARLTAYQGQQLALARLVLADPAVAILDEASAEAGSAGARDLERAAQAAVEGRTALVVAHRLAQAVTADRIVVLESGRVAEQGTHDELVARGGRYAELWSAWSGDGDGGR